VTSDQRPDSERESLLRADTAASLAVCGLAATAQKGVLVYGVRELWRGSRHGTHALSTVLCRYSSGLREQGGPLQDDHEVPQRVGREREPQLTARLLVQACRVRVRVRAGVRVRVTVWARVTVMVRGRGSVTYYEQLAC
jgi:hypothetical protein